MIRVLVLAIALIAGGGAAYMFMTMQPEPPPPEVIQLAPQIQTREILVASADVVPGATLSPQNVRWQAWPEAGISANFIEKQKRPEAINEVTGAVVRSQFYEGEPIREGKLARVESGFMSAILPPGKRAVAVRVSAQSTAGGFILPNDRVDVLHTVQTPGPTEGSTETVTRALLRNIRVLAIDQSVEEKDGVSVVVGKTATLELDPAQADIVTAAETSGTVSLALRSMADADEKPGEARGEATTIRLLRSGRSEVVRTQ